MGPGRTVGGRYRIIEKIGHGGHGEVYRAQQLPLGRDVALKVLLPEAYAGEGPERFVREATLVQTLDHPNTVRLFDFGVDEGGFPFMAFELLRGTTLEDEIAKGPLPPERVARIATQVLKALMDAHARGIIHRDIKPSNVFLVDFAGEKDFVKVLDFGVARRAVESTAQPKITSDGEIVGTPAYMAPEQVKDEPIGPATDLYSLGLVIAEALTGRMVVYGKSQPEIWIKQASSAPVEIPANVLTSAFGPVVLRATNKDPAKRYASAEEMRRAIDQAMTVGAGPTYDGPPATVPMPETPPPPRTVSHPHPPRPSPAPANARTQASPAPASFWTPGAIIAVVVVALGTLVMVGVSASSILRSAPRPVSIDIGQGPMNDGPIEAPAMLSVVEKMTSSGFDLVKIEEPKSLNGVLVVSAFVFAERTKERTFIYVFVYDYRNERDAIYEERTHTENRPEHVVRRKDKRVLVVDDGHAAKGQGRAIAAQLLP